MSGTNKAAQLTPEDMPGTAKVNRVGPEWLETEHKADAYDNKLHIATHPADVGVLYERMRQVGEEPLPEKPKPPPAPTESELRVALAERLTEQHEAEAAMVEALAAAERAGDLVKTRQSALAGFIGLDEQITAHTVQALRSHGRCDLPEVLRERLTARDAAFVDVQAAESASGVLAAELAAARQHLEQRRRITNNTALAVLNTHIARVVERYRAAMAEEEASYIELCSYDRFISPRGGAPPFAVMSVLRAPVRDLSGWNASPKLDTSRWLAALSALLADPTVPIEDG